MRTSPGITCEVSRHAGSEVVILTVKFFVITKSEVKLTHFASAKLHCRKATSLSKKTSLAQGANFVGGVAIGDTPRTLLLLEGLAVGALVHSGVDLVGAHQDALQRAVVGVIAVVSALRNGAFDALVSMAAHSMLPPFVRFFCSMPT